MDFPYDTTVNSQLSKTHSSRILIQLAMISQKNDYLYKVIKKQICHVHMFTTR
jgi:hypothetical protein